MTLKVDIKLVKKLKETFNIAEEYDSKRRLWSTGTMEAAVDKTKFLINRLSKLHSFTDTVNDEDD